MDNFDFSYRRLLEALMQQQGNDALGISDYVRRGQKPFQWEPPARNSLPELPIEYQPPERFGYGLPVRLG